MADQVLIGGGSGLIGQRLTDLLLEQGYEVAWLSHSGSDGPVKTIQWDPVNGRIPSDEILKADYLINLAGAGIADQRWTDKRKQLIIQSRTAPNQLLAELFKKDRETLKHIFQPLLWAFMEIAVTNGVRKKDLSSRKASLPVRFQLGNHP